MKKLLSKVLIVGALTGTMQMVSAQGIPVFDGTANVKNFMEQMQQMQEQLDIANSQLREAQNIYNSTTGIRGFGDLLRNPELAKYLPDDMKNIYNAMERGGLEGIQGGIDAILKQESEALNGSYQESQANAIQRARETAAVNKAMGQSAYQGASERLGQIEALMDEISKTEDQKAIQELQARLTAEQAAIQNELNKANLIAELAKAEEVLVEQQKDDAVRQEFDSKKTGMPGIR